MRQGAEAKKSQDGRLLAFALDNVPVGVSLWDEDERLSSFNPRYLELYGFSPGSVGQGTSLAEIVQISVDAGNHPDIDAPALLEIYRARMEAARRSGEPVHSEKAVRGRVIATTHHYAPGLGWLIQHEDVTERTEERWRRALTEKSLDTQSRRFAVAIDNMSHGIVIFDAGMRVVVCNRRYREIYSLPDEVKPGIHLGRIAELRVAAGSDPLNFPGFVGFSAKVGPPAGRFITVERLINGLIIQVTRSPIHGGGFVAVHQDITAEMSRVEALETSHAELALQKFHFETALAHMTHGLSMYDAEGRLVICNERFRRIYDLDDGQCQPGTSFRELVRIVEERGVVHIPGSAEYVSSILQQSIGENETVDAFQLTDGRTISVRLSPMSDGGFVRIHEDITSQVESFEQLRRAERKSAAQNEALMLQNIRFDAAINNMSQGLCMFDSQRRLVVCNARYAQIYNMPPELMTPGTSLDIILEHRFIHGIVPRGGRAEYAETRNRLVTGGVEAREDLVLDDGRTLHIHHQPMRDGGWVSTHEDVTESRQMEARVRHLARHDPLTDLPNRTFLREEMGSIESRLRRSEPMAVLAIDLDYFKAVNDTLGHAVGDEVLVTIANRLRECARETDVVARLGGDEFAMFATACLEPAQAAKLAARIVKLASQPIEIGGHQVHVGASVGIALAPSDGSTIEALMRNADTALYRAKSEGRGNYHFFEQGMDDALQNRRMIEQGLRLALPNGEFRLVYQPLFSLSSNRICGFEALLRWDHPERGLIAPGEFIPVAEETGLISPIGEWVLGEACRTAAAWPGNVRIAVNLSVAQFRNRGLVQQVERALAESGLAAERLELEVTESLLLADTEQILATLHQLRALGLHISMDDFGTGYSSLSYLRSFPFDKIKIDRSFVSGEGLESNAIIRAVVGLGQSLGMVTTAEGIETEEQLDAVRAQGCDEVQGFLFSPPLPASAAAALLTSTGAEAAPAGGRRRVRRSA